MTLGLVQVIDRKREAEDQTPISIIQTSFIIDKKLIELDNQELIKLSPLETSHVAAKAPKVSAEARAMSPRVTVRKMDFSPSITHSFQFDRAYAKRLRFRMIKRLETDYVFDNAYEIRKFHNQNSFLTSVLREAPKWIQKFFGYCKLRLEYYQDGDERHGELAIIIQSRFTTEENFQLQYELVKAWFAKLPRKIRSRLNLETEPITVWGTRITIQGSTNSTGKSISNSAKDSCCKVVNLTGDVPVAGPIMVYFVLQETRQYLKKQRKTCISKL